MSLSGDKGVAQFKKSVKMGHPIEEFETTLKSNRPRMIIANVEFIASPEVRLVVRDQLWQSALGERCSSGL